MTIGDILERAIKRKGEELGSGALLASVVFITLGATDGTAAIFADLQPHLAPALADASVSAHIRAKCTVALSLGHFITNNGLDSIDAIMDLFQSIFAASFFKGNGAIPTHTTEISSLHASALYAWTLLLTIYTPSTALRSSRKAHKTNFRTTRLTRC